MVTQYSNSSGEWIETMAFNNDNSLVFEKPTKEDYMHLYEAND
jgi:hypothetical protein